MVKNQSTGGWLRKVTEQKNNFSPTAWDFYTDVPRLT